MTGLRTLVALRREGVKPRSVFVDLVACASPYEAEEFALSQHGIVNVTIEEKDGLVGLDLRPLHGLMVFVSDFTGNRKRHRRLAKLVAEVEPSQLIFLDLDESGLTVHQRHADGTTETFTA